MPRYIWDAMTESTFYAVIDWIVCLFIRCYTLDCAFVYMLLYTGLCVCLYAVIHWIVCLFIRRYTLDCAFVYMLLYTGLCVCLYAVIHWIVCLFMILFECRLYTLFSPQPCCIFRNMSVCFSKYSVTLLCFKTSCKLKAFLLLVCTNLWKVEQMLNLGEI